MTDLKCKNCGHKLERCVPYWTYHYGGKYFHVRNMNRWSPMPAREVSRHKYFKTCCCGCNKPELKVEK